MSLVVNFAQIQNIRFELVESVFIQRNRSQLFLVERIKKHRLIHLHNHGTKNGMPLAKQK